MKYWSSCHFAGLFMIYCLIFCNSCSFRIMCSWYPRCHKVWPYFLDVSVLKEFTILGIVIVGVAAHGDPLSFGDNPFCDAIIHSEYGSASLYNNPISHFYMPYLYFVNIAKPFDLFALFAGRRGRRPLQIIYHLYWNFTIFAFILCFA